MKQGIRHSLLRKPLATLLLLAIIGCMSTYVIAQQPKQITKALYIPLTDHYAALATYEHYRDQTKQAAFQIQQMKSWDLLRPYFQSGEIDMAYRMSPLAMDMFTENPLFRWVGLMHRDGNALAINYQHLKLDKAGLKQIIDLAVDINAFADPRFGTTVSRTPAQGSDATSGNQ